MTAAIQQISTGLPFSIGAVAVIAILHIQIATFLTGSTTIAITSEVVAISRGEDPRHERLNRGLVKTWGYIFAFGAATAIFFVTFVLTGLWGRFYIGLQQITFAVFCLEAGTFLAEIAVLYTLYANWERLAAHRGARVGLLVLLNAAQWWQMLFIDVVASFMITPNNGNLDVIRQMFNPTSLPLTLHRTIGNIAWAGAALAAYSGFRYLRATKGKNYSAQEAAYWDWAGQWALIWALALTLLQPWFGYSYAKEIQLHAYSSWYTMMFGSYSNVFLAQITLLGIIIVVACAYLWSRLRASKVPLSRRSGFGTLILLGAALFAAQPAWFGWTEQDVAHAGLARPWWDGGLLNPLGNFIPYKAACLGVMVLVGMYLLVRYMRSLSRQELRWGDATRRSQMFLLTVGVSVSVMMGLMGFIREGSRNQYLVSGELRIEGQQTQNQNTQSGFAP